MVPHHAPHLLHGYYTLLVVLVLVHVLAVLYWAWLAFRITPTKVRRKVSKAVDLKDFKCQATWARSASRRGGEDSFS